MPQPAATCTQRHCSLLTRFVVLFLRLGVVDGAPEEIATKAALCLRLLGARPKKPVTSQEPQLPTAQEQ